MDAFSPKSENPKSLMKNVQKESLEFLKVEFFGEHVQLYVRERSVRVLFRWPVSTRGTQIGPSASGWQNCDSRKASFNVSLFEGGVGGSMGVEAYISLALQQADNPIAVDADGLGT